MKRALSELILDYTLLPRPDIDPANRRSIRAAIEAGIELPPLRVDKTTKTVIDGFHRHLEYMRAFGPDHEVDVVEVDYPDRAAMYADAMACNIKHGKALSTYDVAFAISKNRSEGFNLTDEQLALALNMTVDRLHKIIGQRFATNSTEPLKGIYRSEFAGKTITKKQKEANRGAVGFFNVVALLNQLISALDSGVVDLTDPRIRERLEKVRTSIESMMEVS